MLPNVSSLDNAALVNAAQGNDAVDTNQAGTSGWTYADVWETLAQTQPDRPALLHGDQASTWRQFDDRANGLAQFLLNAGCGHQDKVAFFLYNGPEYLETFYACSKASLVHVNTNYRYGPNELTYLWEDADVVAVVFHGAFADTIESLRSEVPKIHTWLWVDDQSGPCPDWATPYWQAAATITSGAVRCPQGRSGDDLVLIYTGGTTGMPKGVMWRQDDLFLVVDGPNGNSLPAKPDHEQSSSGKQFSPAVRDRALGRPGPASIPACPLMHGTGLINSTNSLSLGGSIITLTERKLSIAELLETIAAKQVKSIFIVGDAFARPILDALDSEPDRWDLSSLRVILSSGVIWSNESKKGILNHYPRLILVDAYGSSEALGVGSSVSSKDSAAETASFKLSVNAVVIDDDGELVDPGSGVVGRIAVRGRAPIGYYKDADKTATTFPMINGVRYSIPGDYATIEKDGTINLLGRGSVCINTAGEKVFPEEVEEALKRVATVRDAIVVGIPDDRFGQSVAAVVHAPAGLDTRAAINQVRSDLAHYKAPRLVLVVDSLERAANGKISYQRWTDYATTHALSPKRE